MKTTPSQPRPDNDRLSRWLLFGIVGFGSVLLIISALIHSQFKRTWKELAFAAISLLVIQSATLAAMFLGSKYWLKTADPRPGFIVSGIYLVAIVATATHFAMRWHLIGPQDIFFYTIAIAVITGGWVIPFSFRKVREKLRPSAVRETPPK
jgi:O-antigen ligase